MMNGSVSGKSVFRLMICITISVLLISVSAQAGNIDPESDGSRYAWGENIGWIDLEPSEGPGVTVTDTAVTGYAWGENVGWIRMDPTYGGVVNDGNGNLSGYAWGENVGWISFSCQDSNTCGTAAYGVAVDPCAGTFSGYAWGENVGWISFSSDGAVPYKVATAWRRDTDGDGTADCIDGCPADPVKIVAGICGCGIPDTDSDVDGVPNCIDGCPADPVKIAAGICGCGVPDTDSDADGVPDCNDNCPTDSGKTEAGICGCGVADTDSDADGVPDCIDNCPTDPGKTEAGICGCGVPDTDSDADSVPDCIDNCPTDPGKTEAGICGCGVADTDSDADGVLDCNDNCPTDPDKTAPGVCGCSTADTDNDSDGTADCIDSDDDNDGLSDEDENSYGTDPLDADTDNDGVSDGDEVAEGTDPLTAQGPGIPILIVPEADATEIILGVFLEVGYGADASAANHQATRWQIALDEGFTSLVMDITTERHLLTLTAPHLALDSDTFYYWRVCFTGDDAVARDWSETGRFTTATDDRGDTDGDLVPDDQEIAADDTITIVPDTETGWRDDLYYLAGEDEDGDPFQAGLRLADDGSSLLFFAHLADIPDDCPADLDMGLFAMKIRVPAAGDSTVIRLYFDPSPLAWLRRVYKYDTVTGWRDYNSYTEFDYNGPYVTLELVDGGAGDADGTSNGVIVDPLGIGTPKVSGGGGGGCFIGKLYESFAR